MPKLYWFIAGRRLWSSIWTGLKISATQRFCPKITISARSVFNRERIRTAQDARLHDA
jgi:hypothetical protein